MTEQLAQRVETPVETPTTPQEEVSAKEPQTTTTTADITEKPLEMGYLKELFKLGESAEHFKMPDLIKEIDDFIISEVDRQGLVKNHKSYEEIIDGYLDKLKLPDNVDEYTKVEKVAEYVRIVKKMTEAMLEREELLNSDPANMSSAQLKRFIKEKYV